MTTKRRKLFAILLLAVIGGVITYRLLNPSDEPKYQGRSLSEWHEQCLSMDYEAAHAAVRNIGTNALPYYLKWMQHESPAWRWEVRRRFSRNGTVDRWLLGKAGRRAGYAMDGFNLLGIEAASAIPELEAIMKNTTNADSSMLACLALVYIGEPAIPVLRAGFVDPNPVIRANITTFLRVTKEFQGKHLCLPILRDALNHSDPSVRSAATNLLYSVDPPAN